MVKRVPIKAQRTPILLPEFIKIQLPLWEAMEVTREDDILSIAQHYDSLVMKVMGRTGHSSLSHKDYTEHRNWIHFERVYEICRMKDWSPNLYLEAQFNRAKGWEKLKYPAPNTLYSKNALKHFINYLGDVRQKYKQDVGGAKKEKGSETKTLRTKVVEEIVASVELLDSYIQSSKHSDKSQYKALKIFHSWGELSPYYLYSVPWFHDVMGDMDSSLMEKCKREFDIISKSPMLKDLIAKTVKETEDYFNIPDNIKF